MDLIVLAGPDAAPGPPCGHVPACPRADAADALAARMVADRLQDSGYALLCNGVVLLEGEGAALLRLSAATPG